MPRSRSATRLVLALAVAAVLAVFLLYTAVAGGSTPTLSPTQLVTSQPGKVAVEGTVVGRITGDSHSSGGLHFRVQDLNGKGVAVPVVYHGDSPPPLFATGRSVVVSGTYAGGRLAGNDIVTKCPSKYTPSTSSSSSS